MPKAWIILDQYTAAVTRLLHRRRAYCLTPSSYQRLKNLALHFEFSGECGAQTFEAYTWRVA